jgi:hypothetical protein
MEEQKQNDSSQPPVEPVVETKKLKRVRQPALLIGSKQQVWEGKADITGGKLKKEDLMECPKTKKIISKKKHLSGLALMERAKKAKENPEDPLHNKFVSFFDHQYKKKEKKEGDVVAEHKEKKQRQKRQKQKESTIVEVNA